MEALSWVATDHYSFEAMNFSVRATDEAFLTLFRRYMGRFRVVDRQPNETLLSAVSGGDRTMPGGRVVRAKRHLYWKTLKIFEGRHDDEMTARLIGFVRDWATMLSNEFLRIRGGGVVLDGKAILIPSVPQPHLPTLVGLLIRSGAGYLGDEMVNLDPILRRIHGLSLPLQIDAEDLTHFPELEREPSRAPRWKLETGPGYEGMTTRRTVAVDELGGAEGSPVPVGWIVFPEFNSGAETRLEPFGGAPALFGFTQAVLNLHVWEDRALLLMREILESVAVSRLVVGSMPEAAEVIARTGPGLLKGVRT